MAAERRRAITPVRLWVRSNVITTVLIIFILVSLLLHLLTIGALIRVRGTLQRQLDTSITQLAALRQQSIQYALVVDQTLPISTTVTISETLDVPIQLEVPIRQTVTLPIDTPAGTFNLDVPLDMRVPISDTVPIPINRRVPIQAEIPVKLKVPVELQLDEPPIREVLERFEQALRELRNGL